MDQTIWKNTLVLIKRHARTIKGLPKARFKDWLIVAMILWHTQHDRPMCWACDQANYTRWFRPRRLPSVSQFSRRVAMERCQRLLEKVHREAAGNPELGALSFLDGKPLTVGPASKDPDAKRGHIMGGFAKGYKLHVWVTEDRRMPVFSVQSLNRGEQPVAEAMTQCMPMFSDQALVLADSNYDSTRLYNALAQRNAALLVKPRGIARHPKTREQSGPYRREMVDLWDRMPALPRLVYKQRIHVEGALSNLTSSGGGLGPLPAWVRGLPRVTRWVGSKIILYHMRLRAKSLSTEKP
jgi:hypothetical protein